MKNYFIVFTIILGLYVSCGLMNTPSNYVYVLAQAYRWNECSGIRCKGINYMMVHDSIYLNGDFKEAAQKFGGKLENLDVMSRAALECCTDINQNEARGIDFPNKKIFPNEHITKYEYFIFRIPAK